MKQLHEYKWMCPEPFTNVHTSTSGNWVPCCAMNSKNVNIEGIPLEITHISTHTFKEFYNAYWVKRLRDAMRNENDQEWINRFCGHCINKEKSGFPSHREWYLSRFYKEFKSKRSELEKIIHDDIEPTFFHSMEFDAAVGNHCNLACNMCSSANSSKYYQEEMELEKIYTNPLKKIINSLPNKKEKISPLILPNIKEGIWEEDLPKITKNLLELKLVGGEPLLAKGTYRILKLFQDPRNTIVRIITNGTHVPDKILPLLQNFKKVVINISIEGVGAINDYIRYPSKWSNILENEKKLASVGETTFVSTINAMNITKLYEVENLPQNSIARSLVDNNYYSLNSIPPDIKDKYLTILYQQKMKHAIKLLENWAVYNENDMWSMLTDLKRRDRLRKTNFLELWPEWKDYYENCRC